MLKIISGIWRPLEADPGGQPGTDLEVTCNIHSCMSKYRFVRVRSSFFVLKIISGIWRPLEADPGGQPGTDLEVTRNMHSCMSKYRFVRVRISILVLKIISGIWRPLDADSGGQPVQTWRFHTICFHLCLNIGF